MTTQPQRVGVIETDLFCDRCGFNLYTQAVTRDERLDLLIVRCPECGGHQSAHLRTTSASKWLNRLALLGMLGWVAVTLAFVVGLFFLFMGTLAAADGSLTRRMLETVDGRPVYANYQNTGGTRSVQFLLEGSRTEVPAADVRQVLRIRSGIIPADGITGTFLETLLFTAVLALVVFACGAVLACGSWFWKPGRHYVWLVVPVLAYVLVQILRVSDATTYNYNGVRIATDRSLSSILDAGVFAAGLATLALGLAFGRPFARLALRLFVPPGPRQLFAFLWHCDHKPFPLQTTPTTPTPSPNQT